MAGVLSNMPKEKCYNGQPPTAEADATRFDSGHTIGNIKEDVMQDAEECRDLTDEELHGTVGGLALKLLPPEWGGLRTIRDRSNIRAVRRQTVDTQPGPLFPKSGK